MLMRLSLSRIRATMAATVAVALLVSCGGSADLGLSEEIAPTDTGVWESTVDYGFAFPNFTANTYPDELFNADDITMLFGDSSDVCVSGSGADCVLTAEAAQFAQMVNTARSWGHCEGFSILAAGRYNEGLEPVSSVLLDSPGVLHALMRGVASQFLPEVQAEADKWAQASLLDKVLYVQRSLDDGMLDVSVGIYTNDAGHALLPYKVTWDGDDYAQIWVYDSNQPGLTVSIQVDLAEKTWRFPYAGGQTWSGGSSMLDLVSIDDRSGKCPFCADAVEVSRAAFYVRSEAPDVGFSVDGEQIASGTVSDDVAFRPMKGQQTDDDLLSLGAYVGSKLRFEEAGLPIDSGDVARGRSGVFYSRATASIAEGSVAELSLPGSAVAFIVTDDGLHKFGTAGGAELSVDEDAIAADGGTLTVVSGNTLVQVDGVASRVTLDFDIEVTHPSGFVNTSSLPEDTDALRIEVDPDQPDLLLFTYVDSDGASYSTTYDSDGVRSPEQPADGLQTDALAVDLEALGLDGEDIPGVEPQQLFATPADESTTSTSTSTTTTTTGPAASTASSTTTAPSTSTSTTTTSAPATTTTVGTSTSTTIAPETTTTAPEVTTTTSPPTTTTAPETTTTTVAPTTTTTVPTETTTTVPTGTTTTSTTTTTTTTVPTTTTTTTTPPTTTVAPSTTTTVPTGTTTTSTTTTTTTTVPSTTTTTTTSSTTTTTTTTTSTTTTTTTTTVPPLAETAALTFDANGGAGAPAVIVDDPGATVSVAETSPQRSGFGFDGWNTDAGGTGTAYASGDDYTLPANDGDVDTLFAQWDPVGYTYVAGTPLDGNGDLQDGSVVELDRTVGPGGRFIFSNDYLMELMGVFTPTGSSTHAIIGVPAAGFDATSVTTGDFLSSFKVYVQSSGALMFEQHNNGGYGASLSRSATALTEDIAFELSSTGELIRLFGADMDTTLSEDVSSGLRHDVGDSDVTPRSIYIAVVGRGMPLPAATAGAYEIAIPTPLPDTYNFAGNVDTLIADSSSEIGHIAVNGSGDVFSVTRAGDAWVSKHDSSAVEQWRIATPVSGDAYLAPASDGGLYIAGLDSGDTTQVNVVKYDGDGAQVWSRNVTTSAGSVELMGLDVLSGSPDEAIVVVGKVAGGSGADLTLGSEIPGVTVPSGHAEYLAFFDASTGDPQLIDATYRGAGASTVRGFTSVDARPNGSGAWWVAVGGGANATSDSTVSCFRFTYDPTAIPPLVEDFSCVNTDYAQDVVLTSDGGVVAATYGGTSTTVTVVKFDNTGAYSWYAEISTDTYAPFPANSRGLEVDTAGNVYVAARRVGNNTTISAPYFSTHASYPVSIPDSGPNGLLVSFRGTDGALNWSRTVGSSASTKASTIAVSGSSVFFAASSNSEVQYDRYREWYTWKPAVFKFLNSGVSHQ